LELVADYTNSAASNILGRFNGDTGSNYSDTVLFGNGSTAGSVRTTSATNMLAGYVAAPETASNTYNVETHHFMNYANTTTNKTVLHRASKASNGVDAVVSLWRSTAAINTIKYFVTGGGNLAVGSTFSLYGIAAEGAAKATGGMVTSDATYYYHTFLASGTFTPLSTLSCDALVIAGGGGGASDYYAGGGGAGGLLAFTSQSISTAQTVTVGAGGAFGALGNVTSSSGADSQLGSLTLVKGGGGAANYQSGNALNGGSGGGGGGKTSSVAGAGLASPSGQGNNGGGGISPSSGNAGAGGGGGGAGAVGSNGANLVGGNGGAGLSTYSSWGVATSTGQNVSGTRWYAGGGGGSAGTGNLGADTKGTGGNGGGGDGLFHNSGGAVAAVATNGTTNTGGGGGGSSEAGIYRGGNGGSGIVIVRYLKA
jgi:hypothetical protein